MRWLDRAGQEFDEAVVNFSIRRARDHAGLTAVTLAPLSSTARQAQIRTVGAAMAAHGGGFRWAVCFVANVRRHFFLSSALQSAKLPPSSFMHPLRLLSVSLGLRIFSGLAAASGGVGIVAAADATGAAPVHATIDDAIARGDVEDVKRHLARDPAAARGRADAKLSPLHSAILRRQVKIVPLLLDAGADPQAPDSAARTPLHLAVERGDAAIVRELLNRKADPTKGDRAGWTPLHLAAAKNRVEIATLLLESGMNPNLLSQLGGTALHEAAAAGSMEIVKLLLARGVDSSIRSKPGVTALDLAREYKHAEVAALLERTPARK